MIPGHADTFVTRLEAGTAAGFPVAPDARISDDGRLTTIDRSLLARVTGLGGYRIVAIDEAGEQFAVFGQVWRGDDVSVCGIRIRMRDGLAVEVESIAGPSRFPSTGGVDARTLVAARPAFAQPVPVDRGMSRQALRDTAALYYAAVRQEQPDLAPLDPAGARIEVGTQITGNPDFSFDFYASADGTSLPNFGEWSAREQFLRGMWNADGVSDERYPVIDRDHGVVLACTTYRPWHKRFETIVDSVGAIGPRITGRRVALNMMEMFKIEDGIIREMESVWTIEPETFASPW